MINSMPSLLSLFLGLTVGFQAAGKAGDPVAEVAAILAQYRQARALQAKVTKTVEQELLGSKTVSHGVFYFSRGKLRLDITEPEKSVLVYDGRYIWVEDRLDEKNIQVTRIRSKDLKKSDSLLAALFDSHDVLKGFKLLERKTENEIRIFAFEPKDTRKTEIRYLELGLQGKEIRRILYRDQVENQVRFEFESMKKGRVPNAKFQYKPPKDASVTNL